MSQAQPNQSGFTIVELMIATIVSSVILLVITYGVVRFTNDYYHGVNASNTQATTQAAVDAITQAIQFNAGTTSPVVSTDQNGSFCAGSQVFIYSVGKPFDATQPLSATNAGLYQMNNPNPTCGVPSTLSGGSQLLGSKMRLTYLSLQQQGSTNIWNLELHMAFGDPDLLCNTTIAGITKGSCQSGATVYGTGDFIQSNKIACKTQTGSQFCSVSRLSTSIGQRIAN